MKSLKINTILNMIKTCSSIIFPLITFPYISRVLMTENVGKVNFGDSYVSYFSLIATLGITTYAIRECAKVRDDKRRLEEVASEIFSINICTTMLAYVLLFSSLFLFRRLDAYRNLIVIQSVVIVFTTIGADWLNSAMEDFEYITIRSIAFQILSMVLMFIFVKHPDDYIKYAAISVVSTSGYNILNVFYRKKYCKLTFTLNIPWKKHMVPILLLFVMTLSQTIFNSSDITMLGFFKGDYEVGIYSTATKMEKLISNIVSSIVFVLMPRLSYMFEVKDYDRINQLLRKVLLAFLTIGLPCYAGATVLAKEAILIIAGNGYVQGTSTLQILMISFLFSLVGGSFLGNVVLLPSGNEKKFMIICCISTIVNIIANVFMIPLFGANGAATTTAFSSFIIMIMLIVTIDKRIKIDRISKVFIAPVVGSVVMSLYCIVIRQLIQNLWIKTIACIGGGVIIYGIIQLLLKNEIIVEVMNKILQKCKRG